MKSMDMLVTTALSTLSEGMHCDGLGLYFRVKGNSRGWIFRYRPTGRKSCRDLGLGGYPEVTLKAARQARDDARKQLRDGVDPIGQRRAQAQQRKEQATLEIMTFKKCVAAYLAGVKKGWSKASVDKWEGNLSNYAYPVLGELPVTQIDAALVRRVLSPVWEKSADLANRLRRKIEKVLDYAKAHGYRSGDNPAQWKGHLEFAYSTPSTPKGEEKHHAALPYEQVSLFWQELSTKKGVDALALKFIMLTAMRTDEVVAAQWDEFDFKSNVWTVPAKRMKMGKEHKVPLTDEAIKVIEKCKKLNGGDYVFPGGQKNPHLDVSSCRKLIKRMNKQATKAGRKPWVDPQQDNAPITPHGFRSTMRSWADDCTDYDHDLKEMALAHAVGDDTEAAYRRTTMFLKRKLLMDDWTAYVCKVKLAVAA